MTAKTSSHKSDSSKPKFKSRPKATVSVNDLKKRIRNTKRLLERVDLPPEARILQERALQGYEKELQDELARRKRSEMIKRYHFVRFLERKHATKRLRRLQREYDALRKEADKNNNNNNSELHSRLKHLEQRIHVAQIDLNYTLYYPLTEKYISLFPKDHSNKDKSQNNNNQDRSESPESGDHHQHDSGNDDDPAKKPPVWAIVEQCTKENTLDLLRDGKLDIGPDGKKKSESAATNKSSSSGSKGRDRERDEKKRKKKGSSSSEGDGEESDDGFFEK